MRVTALAPYPESAPSTRFRLAQFLGPLAEKGVSMEISPFFSEEDYRQVSGPGRTLKKALLLAAGLRRRARQIAEAREADLVLIHRGLAPVLQSGLLQDLRLRKVPIAFDFDDAVFLPSQGGHPLPGRLQDPRAATTALCRAADLVLAGNEYLASFAREVRGKDEGVQVLPTVIDAGRYTPREGPRPEDDRLTVGWIGTHTTVPYLEAIYPALAEAQREAPFRLLVVSNRPPAPHPGLEIAFRRWSEEGELDELRSMDVGIYPLPNDPWTLGKCGFKAIQYMACGLPVVASAVGVMKDILVDGETGFHVHRPEDWASALRRLLSDERLRAHMGAVGRVRAEASYSVCAVLPDLHEWLVWAGRARKS